MGVYRRGFEPPTAPGYRGCVCAGCVCVCSGVRMARSETTRAASSTLSPVSVGAQKSYMTPKCSWCFKKKKRNLIVAVNRQNRSKKQDGCLAIWSCRAREKKGGQKEVRTGPPTLGELTSCPLVPTTTPALSGASRAITTHLIVSKATYEP